MPRCKSTLHVSTTGARLARLHHNIACCKVLNKVTFYTRIQSSLLPFVTINLPSLSAGALVKWAWWSHVIHSEVGVVILDLMLASFEPLSCIYSLAILLRGLTKDNA